MICHDERFKDTIFAVEATGYERLALWREFRDQFGEKNWEEDSMGFSQQVGELAGLPVMVTVFFTKIFGQRVCFYESESMVTHYDMVKTWVMNQCNNPKWYNGYRTAQADAMNFHHAIDAAREAAGLK